MEYKILVVSGDYKSKNDLQAECLNRDISIDYSKSITEAVKIIEEKDYYIVVICSDVIYNTEDLKLIQTIKKVPIISLSYRKSNNKISMLPKYSPTTFIYDHLTLIVETHQVFLKGEKITLTKKEFDLLKYFMANTGFVLTYEQIYNHVWKDDNSYDSNGLLHRLIHRLRDKLKNKPESDDYITAVWGTGYKFGA